MTTKSSKKSTALSTVTTSTGLAVPLDKSEVTSLVDKFKAQLAELKKGTAEAVSLDITISWGGGSSNIKEVDKVSTLLEISSSVHARAKAYQEEIDRYSSLKLKGKVKEFTVSDKTTAEWEEIIQKAIFELINKKQIEKLEDAIQKLSKFEDEQTKFQREIGGIMEGAAELLS